MSVFCLGPEDIDSHWKLYGHHLERLAREDGLIHVTHTINDLLEARKQLWGYQCGQICMGIVITQVYDTPRGTTCEVMAACGTTSARAQIYETLSAIEQWAKSIGCTRVRLQGRRGWLRLLKDYRQVGIILEREII